LLALLKKHRLQRLLPLLRAAQTVARFGLGLYHFTSKVMAHGHLTAIAFPAYFPVLGDLFMTPLFEHFISYLRFGTTFPGFLSTGLGLFR
jgi:hypothetical protein